MSHAGLLLLALLLDAALGEPRWLWSRLPHPAVLMGRVIGWLDRMYNHGENRFISGLFGFTLLAILAWMIGWALSAMPGGAAIELLLAAILIAQKSLVSHVRAVADALRLSTADARLAVAQIVGRDTREMEAPDIARAAIESAAENFSDGIAAPVFWFLIAGLPGLMVYKLTNTADSMIGYLTPQYEEFGKAAARFDDVLNWIPARLTAALIMLVHWRPDAWKIIRRDAPMHRSPNAGWPEAAMAAVLEVALAGPRSYNGEKRNFPWVNDEGRHDPGPQDIEAAISALWRAWGGLLLIVALLAFA